MKAGIFTRIVHSILHHCCTDLWATAAYSFINLARKRVHTTYGSVFPEPRPHGSIIIHIKMTWPEPGEAGGSLSLSKKKCFFQFVFFFSPQYLMERRRDSAIWRTCPHMEAITTERALEFCTQLKWNHRNVSLQFPRSPAISPALNRPHSFTPSLSS